MSPRSPYWKKKGALFSPTNLQHQTFRPVTWTVMVVILLTMFIIENKSVNQNNSSITIIPTTEKSEGETSLKSSETQVEEYHISHVFNTYPVKEGSLGAKELDIILNSWQSAAKYAESSVGLKVEFVEVVLASEADKIPKKPWAVREIIPEYIVEPFRERQMPTIGSIFSTGQLVATSDWLLYTNIDIGTTKEFYVRIYEEANRDLCKESVQQSVLQKTLAFLTYCLKKTKARTDQCVADAKEYFKDVGGIVQFFDQDRVIRDLALLYATNRAMEQTSLSKRQKFPSNRQLVMWYTFAGGSPLLAPEDVKMIPSWKPKAYSCTEVGLDKDSLAGAITFTRIDTKTSLDAIVDMSPEDAVAKIKSESVLKGVAHPGNDCFLIARERIPDMILKWSHPLSFPKWGKWFRSVFDWNEVSFRRVVSSPDDMLTFHLGTGGAAALHWVDFFIKQPMFFMFLQSNWYKISETRALSLFTDLPPWCSELLNFRGGGDKFCKNAPHPGFCNGGRRLSCQVYQHAQMIDTVRYSHFCTQKQSQQQALPEPICEFCNQFLAVVLHKNEPMIPCLEGSIASECDHARCDY